ncbi:hypothetical protein QAD02_022843 [Eretmocerus hayati]|uniref:Uncharacterized protein n=1 Tax=Eretmocerus hayati TaxID=131215 RepID=A0ACC2PWN2_9HYME|nr:hypothetical protein QAD02_022843 [Eretmocerus hayati]
MQAWINGAQLVTTKACHTEPGGEISTPRKVCSNADAFMAAPPAPLAKDNVTSSTVCLSFNEDRNQNRIIKLEWAEEYGTKAQRATGFDRFEPLRCDASPSFYTSKKVRNVGIHIVEATGQSSVEINISNDTLFCSQL